MMSRFDVSDVHAKELRGDFANIWQIIDAHAVSIKHLQLEMAQLSITVNPRQPGTLPSNTIQNPKMMDIPWKSLIDEVRKVRIHLCVCGRR